MTDGAASSVESIYEAVNLFEYVGMLERNLSRRSRREYRKDLDDFVEYLEGQAVFGIKEVNLSHLEGFQLSLKQAGCKQSTVRRKTFALKLFFRFLAASRVIPEDIAGELIPPPPAQLDPRFLTKTEYEELLYVCSGSVRDTALMHIFLQTGMRLSELSSLRLSDIFLPRAGSEGAYITVRRRSGTRDTIPLTKKAVEAVRRYLTERPTVATDILFLSHHNRPLSKRSVQFLVTGYLQKARIEHASVHTLRHTMATHHAAKGTDLKVIQETLGLSSLSQAEQYLVAAKRAQRRALEEHAL